jgi:endonuclease-3
MNKDKRTAIYSTLRELMPSPTTELEYANPFELLIAVILSAQATDISVNKPNCTRSPIRPRQYWSSA